MRCRLWALPKRKLGQYWPNLVRTYIRPQVVHMQKEKVPLCQPCPMTLTLTFWRAGTNVRGANVTALLSASASASVAYTKTLTLAIIYKPEEVGLSYFINGHYYCMVRGRALIFDMCVPCIKTFISIKSFEHVTLTVTFDLHLNNLNTGNNKPITIAL